jgi:hypothetical protein
MDDQLEVRQTASAKWRVYQDAVIQRKPDGTIAEFTNPQTAIAWFQSGKDPQTPVSMIPYVPLVELKRRVRWPAEPVDPAARPRDDDAVPFFRHREGAVPDSYDGPSDDPDDDY